ncbi:hypothetical protein SERLA73DRAFT_41009, partial [Serpula lacrymans var. lacrymans S7.3]
PNPLNTTNLHASHRPNCLTKDRLTAWTPITTRPHPNAPSHRFITRQNFERITSVIVNAWSSSMRKTYGSGLLIFYAFCNSQNIAEADRAPAHSDLIASFIATLAGQYSNKTIRNYVYGIRAWHILHGLEWHMNEPEIPSLLTATWALIPPSSKWPPREPFTIELICKVKEGLDLSKPFDAAFFACITTTLFAAARLGEFTIASVSEFDPNVHCSISGISDVVDRHGFKVKGFVLPVTKTEKTPTTVSWAEQQGPCDPLAAWNNHIDIEVNKPQDSDHTFAYRQPRSSSHTLKPMTRNAFIDKLNRVTTAKHLPHFLGHSLCIGTTFKYLLRGILFEVMKAKGRWRSNTFLIYLHRHAQILTPYIQDKPALHVAFI